LVDFHRRLINDTGLARRCIANFQRDGRSGFYDPEWQSQAREAFERHKAGDFDGYLKWRLYQDWPELEELDKSREKAAAEAHAKKMAEAEERDDEEQRGFKTPTEVQAQPEAENTVGDQEQHGLQMPDEAQASAQPTKVESQQQDVIQISTKALRQVEAASMVEGQQQDKIQQDLKVQSTTEAHHEAKTIEDPEQHELRTPTAATQKLPEESELITDADADADAAVGQGETNEPSGISTTAASDQASPYTAQPSSTTASNSERLPATPPRELSPDVQCVTDTQDPHSPSSQPVFEDLPKPLPPTSDVQLDSLPGSTSLPDCTSHPVLGSLPKSLPPTSDVQLDPLPQSPS
jgi:hypothetical protein